MTNEARMVLDAYEKKVPGAWSYADLENDLVGKADCSGYQDVKAIILEADSLGQYAKTVKHYLQTNKDAHGNVSCELEKLARKHDVL